MAKKTKSKPLPSGTRYSTYVRRSIEKQKSEMVDFQKLTISANALTADRSTDRPLHRRSHAECWNMHKVHQ